MAILIDEKVKVVVQGITGFQGKFHAARMKEYGTQVVAGVTPGKGGTDVDGVPVFDTVEESVDKAGATASIIFVPAPFAREASLEAMEAGLDPVVVITEGLPVHDSLLLVAEARRRGASLVGPNTPGLVSSGKAKMGIMPNPLYRPGPVGVVSKSGTLTYEVASVLGAVGLGQTTCVGIGGDPVTGVGFVDVLKRFDKDPETKVVVLIGEIGGRAEETTAKHVKKMKKPVVAYIAGRTAPPGKKMGHAGAIVGGKTGTAQSKLEALQLAGARIAETPSQIGALATKALSG